MRKLNLIFMICAAVMIVSCGKKTTLENSIPNDAMFVAKVDVKSLVSKADYNVFENKTVNAGLEIAKMTLTDVQKGLLENFQKNPNSLGIDIVGNAYAFMNGEVMGFLLSVNDAEKIHNTLKGIDESIGSKVEKNGDVYSFSMEGNKIMWDNTKMMFLANYNNSKNAQTDYFNLPKEKSMASDKGFKKLVASKSDISYLYDFSNYGLLMENMLDLKKAFGNTSDDLTSELSKKLFSVYDKMKGVSILYNINFETGKTVISTQTFFASAEAEKAYYEFFDYPMTNLSGEFFKYIPQNPLFLMAMNFNGEKILNLIEKLGFAEYLDMAKEKANIDFKSLINSINGDFVFSVNSVNVENEKMPVSLSTFVKLSNPELVKTEIDKILALADLKNDFIKFGVKDDIFYFTSDDNAFKTEAENTFTKRAQKQPMFIYGDLSSLKTSLQPLYMKDNQLQMFAPVFDRGLSLVENYESKYIDKNNAEITINFSDKKQNSLKQFFGFVDEAINKVLAYSLFGGGNNDNDDDGNDDDIVAMEDNEGGVK